MKRRNVKLAAWMLVGILAAGNSVPVYAMQLDEDVILRGTGDASTIVIEDEPDVLIEGTLENFERQDGNQDIGENLRKVIAYLNNHVTNPAVNTIGGEWSVLAMARYGVLPEETKQNYMANLYRTLEENNGVLDKRKYTEYSRVVLALGAIGVNPTDVNGYDLLYPLADFNQVNWQGINGTIYALIALDSKNYEIPKLTEADLKKGLVQTTREKLTAHILQNQLKDGGWALSGTESDADMTAMAIQALVPYYHSDRGVKTAVDRALLTLHEMQNEKGGFGNRETENLESAAQTVIAFSALDVNLLSDETFVKNGNSVLDYLMTYQLEEGSFKHTQKDSVADAMSTDQGALALVAYERAVNGKSSLFDMTDVQIGGDEEETPENIARFRKKLEALPTEIRIKDRQMVYALLSELDQMKEFTEKESFRARLRGNLQEISEQMKAVETLSERIWKEIQPLEVTLKDAETIYALMELYKSIPKENLPYVEYLEDLLQADAMIKKLQNAGVIEPVIVGTKDLKEAVEEVKKELHTNAVVKPEMTLKKEERKTITANVKNNIVKKEELARIKDQDKNLRMEGKLEDGTVYAFTLNGKDVKEEKEINIGVKCTSPYDEAIKQLAKQPSVLYFEQSGTFPGVVQVEVPVEKEDGVYLLLYYNAEEQKAEYIQKVEIKDGQTKFLIEKGGTYFIDKKVSTKSLKEKFMDTDMDEVILQGTKEERTALSVPYIAGLFIVGAAVVAGGGYAFIRKKKKEEGRGDEARDNK